jgi:hypothetical protein
MTSGGLLFLLRNEASFVQRPFLGFSSQSKEHPWNRFANEEALLRHSRGSDGTPSILCPTPLHRRSNEATERKQLAMMEMRQPVSLRLTPVVPD